MKFNKIIESGKKFWEVQVEIEDEQFNEDEITSVENNTIFYQQTLTFSVYKMTAKNITYACQE